MSRLGRLLCALDVIRGHLMVRSIHTRTVPSPYGGRDVTERLWYCDRCEHTVWMNNISGFELTHRDDNEPRIFPIPGQVSQERALIALSRLHYRKGVRP
jgi:hypothetical protein